MAVCITVLTLSGAFFSMEWPNLPRAPINYAPHKIWNRKNTFKEEFYDKLQFMANEELKKN